jgi:hypothetical protein
VFIGRGCDRRQFGDNAMRENFPVTRIVYIGRIVIESGHRGNHSRDHCHRVRVVMKILEKAQQVLVDHGVPRDRILECL